jgi:hypothetical protein
MCSRHHSIGCLIGQGGKADLHDEEGLGHSQLWRGSQGVVCHKKSWGDTNNAKVLDAAAAAMPFRNSAGEMDWAKLPGEEPGPSTAVQIMAPI